MLALNAVSKSYFWLVMCPVAKSKLHADSHRQTGTDKLVATTGGS
jgi:uncharacterized protein YbaR (Trm112 family)